MAVEVADMTFISVSVVDVCGVIVVASLLTKVEMDV